MYEELLEGLVWRLKLIKVIPYRLALNRVGRWARMAIGLHWIIKIA